MRGHLRYRAGAWRLTVDAGPDPITRKRRQLQRTFHAPNTKKGRSAAETALARFVTEVEAGRATTASGFTVDQLLERYIQTRSPSWSPGAPDEIRARIALHISPHIGSVAIDKVRPIDIGHLHSEWATAGMKSSTIGRLHDILRAAFRLAVRWNLLTVSPIDRVDPPRRQRTEIIPPSSEDVARLIDAADDTLKLYLRIAAVTGARRGQVVGLRWGDVALDAGEVRWVRAIVKVKGGTAVKDTKTGARYPVAIDPATVDLLRDHRRRQAEQLLTVGLPLGDGVYLFAQDVAGTAPWHPDGASQRFATLRHRLQLDHVRLHDLRHWMATRLLADGYDPGTMAGRGGWSDTATPFKHYAHFQPARDRDAADHLGRAIDGS